MKTKQEFHELIDTIEDENALKGYLELVKSLRNQETNELWNELTKSEKEELLLSYNDSFNLNNLIPHTEMKDKHSKWLDQ